VILALVLGVHWVWWMILSGIASTPLLWFGTRWYDNRVQEKIFAAEYERLNKDQRA